jgi:hypothetical protein
MTVAEVCTVAPEEYVEAVLRWARSIHDTLSRTMPCTAAEVRMQPKASVLG